MTAAPAGQDISFEAESRALNAYVARPEGTAPFPGVLVIHEAFGLTPDIRRVTDRLAGEGYVALAVDLFSGRNAAVCMARLMGGMLTDSLDHAGVRDLRVALGALAGQAGVDGGRLGAIGFCMGGSLALALSCTDRRLKAVAPYYAMNPRPLEAVRRACPVVGSYPQPDFTTRHGQRLEAELAASGVPHDIRVYPGTRHSFFNADNARTYDPAAAADSWARVLAFFREQGLGPV